MIIITDIDSQIKLIFEVLPNYLKKYGYKVNITKTAEKTVVLINTKKRTFEITLTEIINEKEGTE